MATPLQDFCLKNSMDRGAWWATVHGVTKKSDTIEHEHENFKKRVVNFNDCFAIYLPDVFYSVEFD